QVRGDGKRLGQPGGRGDPARRSALAPPEQSRARRSRQGADPTGSPFLPLRGRLHRAGERVMASVSRFLTRKLRLKVNEAKSAVARPEERKFLGFSISNDGSERRIAPKA